VYTRGNAGEVFPEVMYPLTFSTSVQPSGVAALSALLSTGVVTADEVGNDSTAAIAVLGGYSYLNLSIVRLAATRTPGQSVADADFQYYGKSDAPPHKVGKGDRNVVRSVGVIRYALRVLKQADDPQMDIDQRRVDDWSRLLPDRATASTAELLSAVRASTDMLVELFEHHLKVSNKAAVPLAALSQICTKQLGDPSLAPKLLGGIGDVESAKPAISLWAIARFVKQSGTVSSSFDSGVGGLLDRLRADDSADSHEFLRQFNRFLDEFGSRGPNEWETACDTWGTNPQLPLTLIERLRHAEAAHDPIAQGNRLRDERKRTSEVARESLRPWQRKRFDGSLRAAAAYSQRREQAKTTIIRAIHEMRLILLELDARVLAKHAAGAPKDIWFVVEPELDEYLEHPERFVDRIAERRAMRELLSSREPPFIVNGVVPPFDTWQRRDHVIATSVRTGDEYTGIPGCPGVARGRAVIVTDPSDPRGIGPGDVLVAPLTDPSWTPLFLAAEAVVVDVGAVLSHAVIVSRELAIPCVVSVTGATRMIPNGALIEVDGAAGVVRILELPEISRPVTE
jgi:rifampicin phosphotransferase